MGFDSKWFFADVAVVQAGEGPLHERELAAFEVTLPDRHDLAFWEAFSGATYLAFEALEARLGIGQFHCADMFNELIRRGEIETDLVFNHRIHGAFSGLPSAMRVSTSQASERKKVTKLLKRGSLPASWSVLSIARIACLPLFETVVRAQLDTPQVVAEVERVMTVETFARFLGLSRERPSGRYVLISSTT